jgi:hypothetical protein
MTALRQQQFDRAARHLLRTGQGSIDSEGRCSYAGTGCALAPWAPADLTELAYWDRLGSVEDFPSADLPAEIADDLGFFIALQRAHDAAARPSSARRATPEEFKSSWTENMRELAALLGLSAAVLDEGFAPATE